MAKLSGRSASSRSRFVQQLHDTLSLDSVDLCWDGAGDRFRVAGDDARARRALAGGGFEFRSLSSFVRQLSYYGFKRLSDRRRSGDRIPAAQAVIIFSHPSGHFNRDNPAETSLIVRKIRARKSTAKRRGSSVSTEQDQEFDPDEEAEGNAEADGMKPATMDEYNLQEPHQIYHDQPHSDSFGSAPALKTNWSTFSLPPRAQDHWQPSPYPSPLHAPFPSPLHTPSTATFGLPPQAYLFNQVGTSSTPGYFQSPTVIPPALVEGRFDPQAGSSMHYHPTGLFGGVAPPSPANSSSSASNSDSNKQQPTSFVSPAPAPSRNLVGIFHDPTTTSTADDLSFGAPPIAETHRKPPQYYTLESSHDFNTLYGHTASSD